ncbi:GRIP and coiled-coil domain-containing protein 2-like isoform X1 [Lineus longissimus]|uniref:GRIP and coiled-coil domain-containing protein 2-like isoform X1 n=1 Tax=Lineus longissimus TaxID=88925 RepID=UPI00315DB2C9
MASNSKDSWGDWGGGPSESEEQKQSPATPPRNVGESSAPATPGDSKATPSGKGGKLDNLPRENLIQLLKKQMLLVQKTKANCEELAKKNEELEKKPRTSRAGDDELTKLEEKCQTLECELADLREQNEEMLAVYKQNQDAQEKSLTQYESLVTEMNQLRDEKDVISGQLAEVNKRNKELTEQAECMKMKDNTLTSSFHFMQAEQNKVLEENKELKKELNVLTQARDDLMSSMKLLKEQLGGSTGETKAQLEQLANEKEGYREENHRMLAKIKDLEEIVENLLEEKDKAVKMEAERSSELLVKLESLQVEADVSKSQCSDLNKKYTDANSKVEKLQKEKDSLGKDFAMFRKSSASFKEKLQDVNKMLNDMQQERDRLQSERDDVITENGNLKERLRKKLDEGGNLLEDLGVMKEKFHSLSDENVKLKSQLNETLTESDTMQNMLARNEQKLADLITENSELRLKVQGVDQENEKLSSELELIRCKLDGTDDDFHSQIRTIQSQKEVLGNEIHALKVQLGEIDVMKSEKKILEDEIEHLKVKLSDLENSSSSGAEAVETERKQLQVEADALKSHISNLDVTCSKVDELESDRVELLKDIDSFKSQISELEAAVARATDLETQCDRLAQEVDAAKTKISELENTSGNLQGLETEHESLQQEIAGAKSLISELEGAQDVLKMRISELESVNENLQGLAQERDELLNNIAAAESRVSDLENTNESVSEWKRDQERLLKELEDLQLERDALRVEITDAKRKIAELDHANEHVSELKIVHENLQKEIAESKNAQAQLDDMKVRLEGVQAENEELKASIVSSKHSSIFKGRPEVANARSDIAEINFCDDLDHVTSAIPRCVDASGSDYRVQLESLQKERDSLRDELQNMQTVAVERMEHDIVVKRPMRFVSINEKMTDVFIKELENELSLEHVVVDTSSDRDGERTSGVPVVSLISELVRNQTIDGPCQQCGTLYTELHEKIYQLQVELEEMHARDMRSSSPVLGTERVENDIVLHAIKVDFGVEAVSKVTNDFGIMATGSESEPVGSLETAEILPETLVATSQCVEMSVSDLSGISEKDMSMVVAKLRMTVEILEEKQEELSRRLEASDREKQCLQRQLKENVQKLSDWENIMIAQKDDHGNFLAELVKSEERERRLGKEIEDITRSLHDALQERDRLRDDLCKMLDKDGNLLDEINGLKKQLDEIGAEKLRIEGELHDVRENETKIYKLQYELQQTTQMKEKLEEIHKGSQGESAEWMEREAILLQQTSLYRSEIEALKLGGDNLRKKFEDAENEKVTGKTDEVQVLLQKIESLNAECSELRCQVHESVHLEEMEKQLAGERESFSKGLEALKKDLVDLGQEKDQFLAEMEALKHNLQEVETERDGYKSGVESLKLALEDMLGEKKKQDDEMERKLDEMEQLKLEVDELSAEMKELQVELHDRNRQISDLQDDLEQKVTESRSEVSELKAEMDEMRLEIHQRNEKLCAVKNDNEHLQQCLAEKDGEVVELVSELKDLQGELHHRNEELVDRKSEVDNLLEQLESRHEEVQSLQHRIQELEHAYVHQKRGLELVRANADRVEAEGAGNLDELGKSKDIEIHDLQQRLVMVEAERDGLRHEKMVVESELGGLRDSFGDVENERDGLKVDLVELKSELVGVGSQYHVAQDELKRLSDLEEQLKIMETERDGLKQTLGSASAEGIGLKYKLEVREKSFEELKKKALKMQQMLKEMKEKEAEWKQTDIECKQREAELREKEVELQQMETKWKQADAELKERDAVWKQREIGVVQELEELRGGAEEKIELSGQLERLRNENANLLERLRDMSIEREGLRQSADSTDGMNLELKERVTTFEEEIAKLREKVLLLNNEKEALERSKMADGELQTMLVVLERDKQDLETQRNGLKDQLEQGLEKISCLDTELGDLNDEVSKLRMVNQGAEEVRQALQTSLVDKQSHFDEMAAKLSDEKQHLLEQLDDLRIDLEARKSQEADTLRKFEESSELQVSLQEHIDASSQSIASLQEEVAQGSNLAASLQKQLDERNQSVASLEERLDQSSELVASLQTQLNESTQSQVFLKDELAENAKTVASLQDHIDQLTKEHKLKDENMKKLRTLAIKSKKDVADLKNKLEERITEMESVRSELESFRSQNASLKERLESIVSEKQESGSELDLMRVALEKQLDICQRLQSEHTDLQERYEAEREKSVHLSQENDAAFQELSVVKSQVADLQGEKDSIEGTLAAVREDLKSVELEKESQRIQKEQLEKDKQQLNSKIQELEETSEKDAELYREETKKKQTKLDKATLELQAARKEAKQSSMMDLEMADYERTIQNLNDQIAAKDKKIGDLEKDISRLEEKSKSLQTQLESTETQRSQAEERGNKLKQLLVKTKKDLAEAKKQETQQLKSDSKLRGQLEGALQQGEDYKLQLAELTSENQRLQGQIRQFKDTNQRSVRTLEVKQQTLADDLEIARSELAALQAEYDGYKIRVHHVLKQQKSKTGTESLSAESDKHERVFLEKVNDQLKVKLQETSDQLAASLGENELLQEEHDRLSQRHNRLLSDLQEKENNWREKVDILTAKNSACSTEHAETIRQLTQQNESLSLTFKEQIATTQEEHRRITENLQRQIDKADDDVFRLQRDLQHQLRRSERDVGTSSPQEFVRADSRHLEERQQGEGMEQVEPESAIQVHPSPSSTPLMPLEQLLTSPPEDLMSVKSYESVDDEMLKTKLSASEKKVDHLAQLLNESEATVMRLTEQAKLLKDEIRRIERNRERETSVSNMEYLKNIVLKFISLKGGAERQQLVPVLTTMLRLSPDEKTAILAAAGGDEASPQPTESAGWGSYLHRWSGLT